MTMASVSPMATSSPERKTDKVRRLIREGDIKSALRIAKDFSRGITYGQQHAMRMAYECMVHPQFYQEIGEDPQEWIRKGQEILKQLF